MKSYHRRGRDYLPKISGINLGNSRVNITHGTHLNSSRNYLEFRQSLQPFTEFIFAYLNDENYHFQSPNPGIDQVMNPDPMVHQTVPRIKLRRLTSSSRGKLWATGASRFVLCLAAQKKLSPKLHATCLAWHVCRTKLAQKIFFEMNFLTKKRSEIFLTFLGLYWSTANGGLGDGGLSKSEPSGNGRKRQNPRAKKADFGRFPGREGRHPLNPHLRQPNFMGLRASR